MNINVAILFLGVFLYYERDQCHNWLGIIPFITELTELLIFIIVLCYACIQNVGGLIEFWLIIFHELQLSMFI